MDVELSAQRDPMTSEGQAVKQNLRHKFRALDSQLGGLSLQTDLRPSIPRHCRKTISTFSYLVIGCTVLRI